MAALPSTPSETLVDMLIAQLSDVHVGGARFRLELLRAAIEEVNAAAPDLVVVAGDLTDDGYPDQYPEAREELGAIECPEVVLVPGNHDARNVGYVRFEEEFGARDSRLRTQLGGVDVTLVAVDTSKPDIDEGEVGREHYGWIAEGFDGSADLRVFVCHHHLMPVPGTGRERNQVLDAGDVIALLRQLHVDLVLSGHRHVPYVWPVAGCSSSTPAPSRRCACAVFRTRLQPDQGGGQPHLGRAAHPGGRGTEPRRVSARLARGTLRPSYGRLRPAAEEPAAR